MHKLKTISMGILAFAVLFSVNVLLILFMDVILNKGYIHTFMIQRNPIATIVGFLILTTTEIICLEIG